MSTFGEVRFRLSKLIPGIDHDILDGWMTDRYTAILEKLDWQRSEIQGVLQTVAPYETGTVSLANGSSAVTGTGTTFTSAMTGRQFCVTGRSEVYEFTYVSGTTGTLDRTYEGDTNAEASYSIEQAVYTMPSEARLVNAIIPFDVGRPLDRKSKGELLAHTAQKGTPCEWAIYMDTTGNLLQVILWPTPDEVTSLRLSYAIEAPTWSAASPTRLPWVRPTAIVEGVLADSARHKGDLVAAEAHERQFEHAVADMMRSEMLRRGPATMRLPSRFTRSVR